MTTLLIADDHPMIRSAVSLLVADSDFQTIAQAADAEDALSSIAKHDPEIVLLDLAMPGGSGMEVLRQVRSRGDNRRIVILTAEIDDHRIAEALGFSVDGIVLKNSDPAYLLDCLSCVRDGGKWIDPDLTERVKIATKGGRPPSKLSARERELIALVARGLRNREIAEELGITEGTVKVYLHGIFEKTGVANRTELALRSFD